MHVAARCPMLREDMEALGPIRLRDVDVARKDIVATIKKLQDEGTLSLKGGEGDQFVDDPAIKILQLQ